jgi:beta-glucosidase
MDAGQGVRGTDFVSGWPAGIHVGASWNKNLTRQRGTGVGGEYRTKGVNIALGPVVGPIGRVVTGGRIWENFAVDPYLTGALAAETISGVQSQGVITSTKVHDQRTHWARRWSMGSFADTDYSILSAMSRRPTVSLGTT